MSTPANKEDVIANYVSRANKESTMTTYLSQNAQQTNDTALGCLREASAEASASIRKQRIIDLLRQLEYFRKQLKALLDT